MIQIDWLKNLSHSVILLTMELLQDKRLNIADLSRHSGVERRTIRYYTQEGLMDAPLGSKRGSYYTLDHFLQLRRIRDLRERGWGLAAIKELFETEANPPQPPQRVPGDVSVLTHFFLDEGIELIVDAAKAAMTNEQLRRLGEGTLRTVEAVRSNGS